MGVVGEVIAFLLTVVSVVSFVSLALGVPGMYIAGICKQPSDRGFWHGVLLGPLGWILLAPYPRPDNTQWKETTELLAAIRNELAWQRQQKEKEIHRAKAAAAKHAPSDGA